MLGVLPCNGASILSRDPGGGGGGSFVLQKQISRMSPNKIFMFLINLPSGNVKIQKMIAKHIFECFEKRKGEDGKATLGLN